MKRAIAATLFALALSACLDFGGAYERCVASGQCGVDQPGPEDAGGGEDAQVPLRDGGGDAGTVSDGGALSDAGTVIDAGSDAGPPRMDAGSDAGLDPRRACLLSTCELGTFCVEQSTPGIVVYEGVWAASPCDVWAVGTAGTVSRWNGTSWMTSSDLFAGKSVFAVQGRAANDVWLVGQTGLVRRWNGSAYANRDLVGTANLVALGARFAPTRVVGPGNTYLRDDGSSWTSEPGSTGGLQMYGLWQTTATDIWAVGVGGNVRRTDGGAPWTSVPVPSKYSLKTIAGVWGSSPSNLWVTGDNLLLHWDGGAYTEHVPPSGAFMTSMWGAHRDEIWAVGEVGTIFRWTGGPTWQLMDAGVTNDLTAVAGTFDGGQLDVWVGGEQGLILHYRE